MEKPGQLQKQARSWHALEIEDVFKVLTTNPKGLSEEEAKNRLAGFGPNQIMDKNGDKLLVLLFAQFKNPLIIILIVAAAIAWLLNDLVDALIILAAVVLNAVIGFGQEWKVSNILKELKKFVSYRNAVLRSERVRYVDSKDITLGDILILRQGDRVPADARLFKASSLKINESILTGESTPVEKELRVVDVSASVADRVNSVFMGTTVEEGTAQAVVMAIGDDTEFGKISSLVRIGRGGDVTPLQKRMRSLARTLGAMFLGISMLLFALGTLGGRDILTMFLTSVAVAVAAVPESLPVALTIVLTVGARKILKKGGLVRKMVAAEALGSATVIAADKTATLTEGKMHVTKLITREGKELARESFKDIARDKSGPEAFMFKLLALVSNALIENPDEPEEKWVVGGSSVDKAAMITITEAGFDKYEIEEEMPRLDEIPFSSEFKYSVILNGFNKENNIAVLLGAPEMVHEFLSEKEHGEHIHKRTAELAGEGFKVLTLAYKYMPKNAKLERAGLKDFIFGSIVVLSDPVRAEVKESVSTVQAAGLRLVMVTGDHLLTAKYVAKEVGILKSDSRAIESKDLPEDLDGVIYDYDVFARVTPEEKVRIAEAFKKKKETVVMIGDGVNDAPVLLDADLGVAVGSGTDVAKEASDLVLLNDSFSILAEAVRQGRIILDNIKKVTIFLLASSFSEIILISGSIIMGLPLALLPAQILWVNIIVDGLPAITLATEKEENNVMKRRPSKNSAIFSRDIKMLVVFFTLITDLALFLLFYYLLNVTGNVEYARTMVFVGLGLTSLFYIFSVRSLRMPVWRFNPFSNKFLNLGVLLGLVLYYIAIYVPGLNGLLGTVPLHGRDWSVLLILGLFNVLVIEVLKSFFLKKAD